MIRKLMSLLGRDSSLVESLRKSNALLSEQIDLQRRKFLDQLFKQNVALRNARQEGETNKRFRQLYAEIFARCEDKENEVARLEVQVAGLETELGALEYRLGLMQEAAEFDDVKEADVAIGLSAVATLKNLVREWSEGDHETLSAAFVDAEAFLEKVVQAEGGQS
jgi:hypothetical protein